MTRLFLASALAVGAAMHFVGKPAPSEPAVFLDADLFGIEDLDAGAAQAAGLLDIGPAGQLRVGASWQSAELETWAFDPERRSFGTVPASWLTRLDAKPGDFAGSLNAELVRQGLALGHVVADGHLAAGRVEALMAAAAQAQAQGQGQAQGQDDSDADAEESP